jgi:murein DD-endopeptidase / murein LD-carboxypeptidase
MCSQTVSRARDLIGVTFRLHGRNPEHGLDCIGLAAHVFGQDRVPTGYGLRGTAADDLEAALRTAGFVRRHAMPRPGDLFIMQPGPLQLHLGVWTGSGLIHADAGLRRVVETPGWPRWRVLSIWFARKRRD